AGECPRDVGNGRAAHLDAGVAPRAGAALRIADPHLPDTQAADVRNPVVDADRLAVVAAEPAQRTVQARRIERAHLDAGVAQPVPVPAGSAAQAAEPVVQHAYAQAPGG